MRDDILEQAQAIRSSMDKVTANLTNEEALEVMDLYLSWAAGVAYAAGDIRRDAGVLYKCIQAHTSQADWQPAKVPALWKVISVESWPEWVQPTGAHDAYDKGAQVSHNGKHWTSDIAANVYEPGVYGWTEVTK